MEPVKSYRSPETEENEMLGSKPSLTALSPLTPGQALWNQREAIADLKDRFKVLSAAVGRTTDLNLYQWAEFAAFALEFRPDLIVELGRGLGNSTCCFIEVAHRLGGAKACRVLSLCLSDDWFKHTVQRLEGVVPSGWFTPGQVEVCNILRYDLRPELSSAGRCLILWDAHGFEIAEWVLCELLPQLVNKSHVVLMHDMSDNRYEISSSDYGEQGIWHGTDETIWMGANASNPSFWLGHISSRVPQAISIIDFTSRNRLPLHSAAESLFAEIISNPARMAELRTLLGDDFFSPQAHWYWFSLNEASRTISFPRATSQGGETMPRKLEPQLQLDESDAQLVQLMQAVKNHLSDQDLIRLIDTVNTYGRELADMPAEKQRLEVFWRDVQDSAGWRLLNRWRTLRSDILPVGTRRRKLYDSVLGPFRGRLSPRGK